MNSRLELQAKLESLLGTRNVYYQPPENIKMTYPCIVYNVQDIDINFADNRLYNSTKCYQIIVVSKTPDNPVITNMLNNFMYINYDRQYISDNLYHTVLTLYY